MDDVITKLDQLVVGIRDVLKEHVHGLNQEHKFLVDLPPGTPSPRSLDGHVEHVIDALWELTGDLDYTIDEMKGLREQLDTEDRKENPHYRMGNEAATFDLSTEDSNAAVARIHDAQRRGRENGPLPRIDLPAMHHEDGTPVLFSDVFRVRGYLKHVKWFDEDDIEFFSGYTDRIMRSHTKKAADLYSQLLEEVLQS